MSLVALLPFAKSIIDRVIPDKGAAAEAKLKLIELEQRGELAQLAAETELRKGQMAINAEEAKNPSIFVSGWRPFIGWVCGLGLAYEFLVRPILVGFGFLGAEIPMGDLLVILGGLLGLGTLRTTEKIKGVAAK